MLASRARERKHADGERGGVKTERERTVKQMFERKTLFISKNLNGTIPKATNGEVDEQKKKNH